MEKLIRKFLKGMGITISFDIVAISAMKTTADELKTVFAKCLTPIGLERIQCKYAVKGCVIAMHQLSKISKRG